MSFRNELENRIADQQRVVNRLSKQLALAQAKLDDMKLEMRPVIEMLPEEIKSEPLVSEPFMMESTIE